MHIGAHPQARSLATWSSWTGKTTTEKQPVGPENVDISLISEAARSAAKPVPPGHHWPLVTRNSWDPVPEAPPALLLMQSSDALLEVRSAPVIELTSPSSPELKMVLASFPDRSIFRIINEHMIETALSTGTDKGRINEVDVRRLTGSGGYDVWDVEAELVEQGLTKADVFCGTPKEFFLEDMGDLYRSEGLGLPSDRSAILVFDGNKVAEIRDTDGYRFLDPADKKSALLGVVRFPTKLAPFELELRMAGSPAERMTILEREVRQGLQRKTDLDERSKLLSLNITNMLYDSPQGPQADQLISLAAEFKERSHLIENWDNLQGYLDTLVLAREANDPRRLGRAERHPAFVIKQAEQFLREHPETPPEFVARFLKLVEDAKVLAGSRPSGL